MSLLICGWDTDRPYLFQCDPSGAYFPWKATAMGKNFINGKTFLEKRLVLNIFVVNRNRNKLDWATFETNLQDVTGIVVIQTPAPKACVG